ncbi:MAG: lasso peptide biosynthesis B2 protein [Thermoanaerobaculia bacterium]|nr:lasso peptide biosynthesis B2 protein [Thermoanaerobaculia bacterium]
MRIYSPSPWLWLGLHLKACVFTLLLRWKIVKDDALTPDQSDSRPRRDPEPGFVELAFLASRRAVRFLSPLDTCLPRSIVLYELLEPLGGARLHYGFLRGERGIEGHAWVSFRGEVVGEPAANVSRYTEVPLSELEPGVRDFTQAVPE